MTIAERVKMAIFSANYGNPNEPASIEKMLAIAYYMGREDSAKELCDKHNTYIKEATERANRCRYRKLAHKVIGTNTMLYSSDYCGSMTTTFGGDRADSDVIDTNNIFVLTVSKDEIIENSSSYMLLKAYVVTDDSDINIDVHESTYLGIVSAEDKSIYGIYKFDYVNTVEAYFAKII